jgi:hypothetical protein
MSTLQFNLNTSGKHLILSLKKETTGKKFFDPLKKNKSGQSPTWTEVKISPRLEILENL